MTRLIGKRAEFRGLVYGFLTNSESHPDLTEKIRENKKAVDHLKAIFLTHLKASPELIPDAELNRWRLKDQTLEALFTDLVKNPQAVSHRLWLEMADSILSQDRKLTLYLLKPVTDGKMIELLAVFSRESSRTLDAMGREMALVGKIILSGNPISHENWLNITEAHGRIRGIAELLLQAVDIPGLSVPMRNSLVQFQKEFDLAYESKWQEIISNSDTRHKLTISYNKWRPAISRGIDALENISEVSNQEILELTQGLKDHAFWDMKLAVTAFTLWLLLFVILIQWLLKNLRIRIRCMEKSQKIIEIQRNLLQSDVQRRTAELQAIVDTAVDGIIVADGTGRILEFNRSAQAMFGYRSKEILGESIAQLMSIPHRQYIENILTTGRDSNIGISRELEALRKNGKAFPVRLTVGHAAIEDRDRIVAFVEDISQRKSRELELIRSRKEALAAVKARNTFLANMSHEIRTPMNSIMGFLRIVMKDPELSPTSVAHLSTANDSAHSLLNIINDIFDMGKLNQGIIHFEKICLNLPHLIKEVLDGLTPAARKKYTKLNFTYGGDLPHCFLGDPARLKQMLFNLLGNAVKFTPTGHVSIEVKQGDHTDTVNIEILDTGIGIPENKISEVFEQFSQADDSISRRYGGTGLGLPISKQIIDAMGGSITIMNNMPKGTRVSVSLNLPKAKCVDACAIHSRTVEAPAQRSPRAFRILLAEDVPQNALLVRIRLEEQHHVVTIVQNGLMAIEAACNGCFDVILMDVHMSEMDGLAATRKIRQYEVGQNIHTPIIALTASILAEDRQLCMDAGMDEILPKPIDFETLFVAMETLVPKSSGVVSSSVNVRIDSPYATDALKQLKAIVDLDTALKRWGHHPRMYIKNLKLFAVNYSDTGIQIQNVLANNNFYAAYELNHRLKGVCGNLGISRIETQTANIAEELKKLMGGSGCSHREVITADLKQKCRGLVDALDRVIEKINAVLPASAGLPVPGDRSALSHDRIATLMDQLEIMLTRGAFDDCLVSDCLTALNGSQFQEDILRIEQMIDNFDYENAVNLVLQIKLNIAKANK